MKFKSLIFIATAFCIGNFAQAQQTIPNASFENWTNFGTYSDPTSWSSYNSQLIGMGYIPTCEKGSPAATGDSYLKLTVKSVNGVAQPACVLSNPVFVGMKPGFPYNLRPTTLTGKWKYSVSTNNITYIIVKFWKWDPIAQISNCIYRGETDISPGIVNTWTNFNLPITFPTEEYPDSAFIKIVLGEVTAIENDYLYIDDLSFSGTVGVSEVQENSNFSVFPNPSNGVFTIQNIGEDVTNIDVFNLLGEKVFQSTNNNLVNNNETAIDLSKKPKGIYFIQVTHGNSITTKKIVIE